MNKEGYRDPTAEKAIHNADKILAAGIKTNPVFYAETDKRNFYERKK